MTVLGVDPGTAVLGFGVVTTETGGTKRPWSEIRIGSLGRMGRLIECGVIRTNPRAPLPERLRTIHEGLIELIDRHRPDAVAVEDIFYGTNVRTTAVLGHARGVVLLAAALANVPVAEYSPARIKKVVVGRGAALKPQVGFMVARLLGLRTAPSPADAADGVAVALTHVLSSRTLRRVAL